MKFSIYTEIQYWGGKSHKRLYEEVIEQVVHADRLGYDCYTIIEHFFFPKFSISTNPFAFWAVCAERTTDHSSAHARPRPPVPQPDDGWLRRSPSWTHVRRPLRVGAAFAATAGSRSRRACRSIETRDRYEETLDIVFKALDEGARSPTTAPSTRSTTRRSLPPPERKLPHLPGGHERPHLRARGRAWLGRRGAAAPPVRRARGAARPLPLEVRRARHRRRTSSGSTRATSTRIAMRRGGRRSRACGSSLRETRRR